MRKILALSLFLVLVFAMGAMAGEGPEGPLGDNQNLDVEVPVEVTIGKYARVWVNSNRLFEDVLQGKPGLYTSNKHQVQAVAAEYFEEQGKTWGEDSVFKDTKGGTLFRIESNSDVDVSVDFNWDDQNIKLNSEMILVLWRHNKGDNYPLVHENERDQSMYSTTNVNLNRPVTFIHEYAAEELEYKIGGAIFIDYISQQQAGEYPGTITVTLTDAS